MNIRSLQVFLVVCEVGSLTVASERLGVTQGAVSQTISALEKEHRAELLDRTIRPLKPTAVGRRLQELAGPLVEHAQSVTNRIGDISSTGGMPVRLGCADSFASTFGPEIIRGLSGSAREISLWSGLTAGLSKQLCDGDIDLVIAQNLNLPNQRYVEVPLFSESLVLAVSKKYAEKKSRDWRSVTQNLPLIKYSGRSALGQQVERLSKHLGVSSAQLYEFDATDAVLSLVSADLGFAISTPLCLWQARHYLSQIQIIPLPAGVLARREITMVYRRGLWEEFSSQLKKLTISVLEYSIRPALSEMIGHLPEDSFRVETANRVLP